MFGNVDIQPFRRCDFEHMHRLMKNPGCRTVTVPLGSSHVCVQRPLFVVLWAPGITCVGSAKLVLYKPYLNYPKEPTLLRAYILSSPIPNL